MSAGAASLLNIQRGELTAQGWTQVHTYQCFTTDGTDGPDEVLSASGLPGFGSALVYDPLARVSRITPIKQEDATNHWHIDVEYSRETANQQDHQQPPTLRRTKRSASVRWVQRALQQDEDGAPIITSAKTPFNPPIEIQVPHKVVRFERWEQSFTTATQDAYLGKVNSDTFGVYAPGWVMCTNIEATEQWEQDANGEPTLYWLVVYEFEACYDEKDTFRPLKVLDADFWMIDPTDDKRKPIYITDEGELTNNSQDRDGATPPPSPMPLGSDGAPLLADDLPDAAHYLEFNVYGEADFNELNLSVD